MPATCSSKTDLNILPLIEVRMFTERAASSVITTSESSEINLREILSVELQILVAV